MNLCNIKNIFICKFCYNIFQEPLLLPCGEFLRNHLFVFIFIFIILIKGNLICAYHINEFFSSKKCLFCDKVSY